MTIRWKTFILQIAFWLVAECTLTLLGMDDLADYGEYQGTLYLADSVALPHLIMNL